MIFESGSKAFIIAEVGSNWATLEDCLYSIRVAKVCGADAVKFQLFNLKALYGTYLSTHDRVSPYLDEKWLPQLKEQADSVGIEFMCSAFSPYLYEIVNPYVNIHKVASAEMMHVRILQELNTLGKPVILSTGAASVRDIGRSIKELKLVPLTLLYCVASYPAKEINLENINELSRIFSLPCGFSDHSTDTSIIPRAATNSGACVIEKHFQAVDGIYPDSGHSLNPDQFKRMVRSIRDKPMPSIGSTYEEREMITQHVRRLIAIKDIKPGDTFKEDDNFGIYRSLHFDTHAYSPFMADAVNGMVAKKEIKAGKGIGPGDL